MSMMAGDVVIYHAPAEVKRPRQLTLWENVDINKLQPPWKFVAMLGEFFVLDFFQETHDGVKGSIMQFSKDGLSADVLFDDGLRAVVPLELLTTEG